ncbi:ABC transporter permease [Microbacterium hatanonis]|jgi:peptide/nickel transport system permease protein|uniref:ABC transporter permease n=1 Tax=Microbacterium hatanonis TaxID=404366 RepID=A0A5C8I4A4_9MICO|nr:ABC transporter permease [Microbacterium hatanonis]TXK12805.1 ABC transporter permease [Microbacterium hatanonis]
MRGLWLRNVWWVQRVALLPVHLFLFAIAVFFLVRLIPGDPVMIVAGGDDISAEQYAQIQDTLGLGGTLWEQLLTFLGRLVTLNLGRSPIDGLDVQEQIAWRLPATVEIAVIAMVLSVLSTFALTIFAMMKPRNWLARWVTFYARSAGAIPDFVLGVAGILIFYTVLQWAPAPIGRYDAGLRPAPRATGFPLLDAALSSDGILLASMAAHLWLPVLVLVVGSAPTIMKVLQRAIERAVADEATQFRIASGAPRRAVIASIMRRSMPAMVTMCGQLFGFLLGGAVIIEQLFSIPGMGQYAIQAVGRTDFLALQAFLLTVAAAVLVVFLLVDLTNMVLDPRRRPGVLAKGA